ncbi:MAG: hypothetical protein Q7K26_00565 [bacterium]|nr:hypothetical protein [bacterium]
MNFSDQLTTRDMNINKFNIRIVGKGFVAETLDKSDFCFVTESENAKNFSKTDAFHNASRLYHAAGHPAVVIDRNRAVHIFGTVH